MPPIAEKLLEIIKEYAALQCEREVLIPKEYLLNKGFTADELDLAEICLIKNGYLLRATTRERLDESYIYDLVNRDKILASPFFMEGKMRPEYFIRTMNVYFLPEDSRPSFDDKKSMIIIEGKEITISPATDEYDFCKYVFKEKIDKVIDWSGVYEFITGKDSEPKDWRKIYDLINRLNKKIKKVSGIDDFFVWKNKTLRRQF
jgi:hypothetical protein